MNSNNHQGKPLWPTNIQKNFNNTQSTQKIAAFCNTNTARTPFGSASRFTGGVSGETMPPVFSVWVLLFAY